MNHRFLPTSKPAIPEFHAHQGPFLPMLIKEFLHLSKIIASLGAKIPCHKDVVLNQGSRSERCPPWTI